MEVQGGEPSRRVQVCVLPALHRASCGGRLEEVRLLVRGGADVWARDGAGLTALDAARCCRHREVVRYLRSCMWEEKKRREAEERRKTQRLLEDLMEERRRHEKVQVGDPLETRRRRRLREGPASLPGPPRPWAIYSAPGPPGGPDLLGCVELRGGRRPQLLPRWDPRPRPAPDLPPDLLRRALFPAAFPPRMASQTGRPADILQVRHRGRGARRGSSPWTEVALHLAESLEAMEVR